MGYYLSSVMAAHLLRPDVDPVSEPVSNYAVGPYGFLISIAIFTLGVGSLALTLGLHLGIAPPGRSRVGLLLLALYGVGQLGVAIFSMGDRKPEGFGCHPRVLRPRFGLA